MGGQPRQSRAELDPKVDSKVQFFSDRTCCVCREPRKFTQVHHMDGNPANNCIDNLALLCFECHGWTQVYGAFGRKLDAQQVRIYRDDWYERVEESRALVSVPARGEHTGPGRMPTPEQMATGVPQVLSGRTGEPLSRLAFEVASGNCSALISADLGKLAGYPELNSVVVGMARRAGVTPPSGHAVLGGQALRRLADECLEKMGPDLFCRDFEGQYRPDGVQDFSDIHSYLVGIPFNALVTTNLDPCLEMAALRDTQGRVTVYSYPDLETADLRGGHIYHLHGRAYDERGRSQVRMMIIGEKDHQRAYDPAQSSIHSLVQDLLWDQTVLFVGLPTVDSPLGEIVRTSLAASRQGSQGEGTQGEGQGGRHEHFAIVPGDLPLERGDLLENHERFVIIAGQGGQDPYAGLRDILRHLCTMFGRRQEGDLAADGPHAKVR